MYFCFGHTKGGGAAAPLKYATDVIINWISLLELAEEIVQLVDSFGK